MRSKRHKTILLIAALAFGLVPLFLAVRVSAATLGERSVRITNPRPGESADHLYGFEYPSASNIGSVAFEFCDNSAVFDGPCTPPAGFNADTASLVYQDGETGYGIHPNTTVNRLVISRPPAAVTPGAANYVFENIVNSQDANNTVYVRIHLHASDDGTGPTVDFGAVAFSTSQYISVDAYVPPYLLFCAALTVNPDCTTSQGNYIDFGELESNLPSTATSQYSGATNDDSGYTVSVHGTTMTAGNNVIPALESQGPSVPGSGQFGINLRNNTNPNVGINPSGPGNATASGNYATPNLYRFRTGDVLSSAGISSSYDLFTVSYVVNVESDQPPGIYATTLTYVALASF
ncbi:MAG: hypothetical protein U5L95_02730 [Candidatus Saccharibacteria bacterium]|nr:hypothetical protein [Candidatus Saccharibacteria bacterium]